MKREVTLTIDSVGRLLGVSYHDGYMTRFCLDGSLTFELCAIDDSLTELVMVGIELLCTDPLWEAAIVTDIDIWKAVAAPDVSWELLLEGRGGNGGVQKDIERYLPRFADFWLVQVGTAYGGGFSCLCESIKVFQTLPGNA